MKPCGCPDNLVCAYCVPARVMDPKRPARCSVCDKPKAIPADFAGDTQAADLCWSRAPFEACREKAVDWRARALKAEVSAERCPNCDLPGPCKLGVVEKFAADHPANGGREPAVEEWGVPDKDGKSRCPMCDRSQDA